MSALAWFCLGLAAVKAGMIDNTAHPLWARARRICLAPGVALSLAGAGLVAFGSTATGAVLVLLAAPIATLGYLGVIAAIANPPGPFMARVLATGGSSLSIYLGQSIVLSTIFSGYGLGLWGALSYVEATLVAVLVTMGLMIVLTVWRTRYARGPFEWVLRRLTYAGQRG